MKKANGHSDWLVQQLGEVIELFDHKRVPLNSRERQQRQGRYPYYGAQGVIDHVDGYMFDGRYILVAEDGENLNSKKLPLALFASGKFWVNNHAHVLRAKQDVADDTFVLACLNNADIKPYVTGAAQPKLSQANLRQLEIPLPPLPVQRRIAGILSAYDDLIENNQRRINILEEMARSLYREWFVHFRCPGHDKVKMVPSSRGPIPQGWGVEPVESFCQTITRGVTPKYESGSGRLIINQKVNRGSLLSLDDLKELEIAFEVQPEKFARFGDVLVNCLGEGTIGRVHFYTESHQDWAVDQHMSICRAANPADSLYVYLALESSEGQGRIVALKTGGTNMTMLNISALRAFELVAPPIKLRARFAELVLPVMCQKQALVELTRNLRRTRDLLLPRLLSGELNMK